MKNGDRPIATLVATDNLARTMRSDGVETTIEALGGLTKREHFAIKAMQGLLAGGYGIDDPANRLEDVSFEAVSLADALLKALENDK